MSLCRCYSCLQVTVALTFTRLLTQSVIDVASKKKFDVIHKSVSFCSPREWRSILFYTLLYGTFGMGYWGGKTL